jgi:hypothetical protein
MTCINEPERPVVCNISFFNKKASSKEVASLSFVGDGNIYPLNDVSVMFTRAEYGELRITSVISLEKLLDLFRSEEISLRAALWPAEYTFIPNEEFLLYQAQFLQQLSKRE